MRNGDGCGGMTNTLYYGDNLSILRESIRDESVDLIYLDPPFNSNASYNVLFKSPEGQQSDAQIEAFGDTWHWGDDAERAFDEVIRSGKPDVIEMLRAMRSFLKENDMMAYLAMMAVRLIELHRVLKPTGSMYLHCDPTASHYLKILIDAVFGAKHYGNEISWKRSSAHSDAKQGRKKYGNIRDIIYFYSKHEKTWTWNWQYTPYDESYTSTAYRHADDQGRRYRRDNLTAARPGGDVSYLWPVKRLAGEDWTSDLIEEYKNPVEGWEYKQTPPYHGRYWAYSKANMKEFAEQGRLIFASSGMPEYKRYLDEMPGVPLQNNWDDIPPAGGNEYLGYPTQKPLALLERIVGVSSNEGDVVLDPFCGCGTAVHAAHKLGRQWIGIDITHLAVSLIEKRLNDAFPTIEYKVEGAPKDLSGARALAAQDKYQFQWWAVSLVNAVPYGGKKKGADGGIDGYIYFYADKGKSDKAIVSVKGGDNVGVAMVRDLIATASRDGAKIGVMVTLSEPTSAMLKEAASAGLYIHELTGQSFPKVQIFTVEELFAGKKPDIPWVDPVMFKKAGREDESGIKQGKLI